MKHKGGIVSSKQLSTLSAIKVSPSNFRKQKHSHDKHTHNISIIVTWKSNKASIQRTTIRLRRLDILPQYLSRFFQRALTSNHSFLDVNSHTLNSINVSLTDCFITKSAHNTLSMLHSSRSTISL